MKNLDARVDRLEQRIADALPIPPAIILFGDESEAEGRAKFTQANGYPPAINCKVIRFTVIDCSMNSEKTNQ